MSAPPVDHSILEEVAQSAQRLRARFGRWGPSGERDELSGAELGELQPGRGGGGGVAASGALEPGWDAPPFGQLPGGDEAPTAPLLADAPSGARVRLRAPGEGRAAAELTTERQRRLAHLRRKYHESEGAGAASSETAAPVAAPERAAWGLQPSPAEARPRGDRPLQREPFEPPSSRGEGAASDAPGGGWSAFSLPAGVSASSLVVVNDFWNAKLRQLTLHTGGAWPDEELRGPQFRSRAILLYYYTTINHKPIY